MLFSQWNHYIQNENISSESESSSYNYYIRPFIPFFTDESLTFEEVNECDQIELQRDTKYTRFLLEKLTRTWLSKYPMDKMWFDQQDVYKYLKTPLVNRILCKDSGDNKTKLRM